jgi:hypothetical protein
VKLRTRPEVKQDGRCDAHLCWRKAEIMYLYGATEQNRNRSVGLCDDHHKKWLSFSQKPVDSTAEVSDKDVQTPLPQQGKETQDHVLR